jgi:putative PEP-CTERM system TPR-repeat lipoprotein
MHNTKALSGGLFILALLLATSACDQTKRFTDQEHVQRARDFQDQRKLDSAVIELKNALQKNPKNSEARLLLGEVYATQGLGEPAENELKKARELGMDYEALKVPMGQALLLQRSYARVLAEIQPGPKSPPANVAKILEIQARAHLGLFHFKDGCRLFARALEKDPHYVPGYWGLARCAAVQGDLDEARTELAKAVKLDEKNSDTWTRVGDLERVAKRLPEAESGYDTALKYNSNNIDALLGRAILRIDSNKLAEATKDIDAAAKIASKNPIVRQLRGVVEFKQRNFAAAETSFQSVLSTQPDYLPAVLWLGLTNFAAKNYEQAATQFAKYTRSVPSVRIKALLGLAQARLGHADEAEETLRVLRNVDVKDPQSLATLAEAYMFIGEADLATTYLAKAVEQRPDAAGLRVDLAKVLSKKGERVQAIGQLETAIQLDPGVAGGDVLLIQNLIREKQFGKALQAVESLEKKQPTNPATFNLKAAIYLGKNDLANARKSFEQALELEPTSVATAMNLAQLDLREKNPGAARQRFQSILAKDTANVQAMMGLAALAAATAQESEYVTWLEKAAQAGPSDVRPRVLLAEYYLKKNDLPKALALAREAENANPNDTWALDALGTAQLAAGEKRTAVVTYSKLAKLIPKNPIAHYKLAMVQVAAQDLTSARASLNKALALKPDYVDAEILLASLDVGAGHFGEALNIAKQIQKQQAGSASGFVLQGDIQMAQKQFVPALRAYEKALAINNSGLIAVKIHQVLSASVSANEANARLDRWLKDQPDNVTARAYLAAAYLRAGANKQAIEQYQLLLQTDPKNILALNDLAWLYQQENDPRALTTAEQAYQLKPDSPQIMDTLGWILVEQGKTAEGLGLLQKAAEKAPESTAIRYHWAATLAKSGDRTRARAELADLLAKNRNFPQRQEVQALLKQLHEN